MVSKQGYCIKDILSGELAKEQISERLKDYVMDTCHHLLYLGRDLIVLNVVYRGEVSYYAAEKYV